MFIKAVDDKLGEVRGAVTDEPPDAPGETPVLVADPVVMDRELRLFCLDGEVLTGSGYWRDGREWQVPLEDTGIDPRKLVEEVWNDRLPSAVVIDVATVGDELVVVEANGAWGASLYASDAVKALPCVLRATLPGARGGTDDAPTANSGRSEGRARGPSSPHLTLEACGGGDARCVPTWPGSMAAIAMGGSRPGGRSRARRSLEPERRGGRGAAARDPFGGVATCEGTSSARHDRPGVRSVL